MNQTETVKRIFAPLLISAITCFGVACDSEGTPIESASEDLCAQYARCNAEDFDEEYSSQADCVAETEADLAEEEEFYKDEGAERCFDIWLEVIDCFATLSCEEWNDDDDDTICADVFLDYDECEEEVFGEDLVEADPVDGES